VAGGAIFAVPLLVYWIGVDPPTAVAISLVTVAATAAVGAVERWRYGQVELPTGLLFAAAGGGPACRRDPEGRLRITSRCATVLALVGLAVGLLSGLFGVGGGSPARCLPGCSRSPSSSSPGS
jgi:uncharacterized membrane protein YfcA